MKIKYLIDHQPVKNLRAWCEERKLSLSSFKNQIHKAKKGAKDKEGNWTKKPSKDCVCLGHYIVKVDKKG
jgi:hypothetical protein